MAARRLLYLTNQQLTACRWDAGKITVEASFEARDAASGFVGYLQANSRSLFAIVVNVAEEGFQVDTIPFLKAADRSAVIDRKLGQIYQGAPLSVAMSLGYEKSRRKDERLLFAALTNPATLEPWLQAIRSAEVRLAGIYSVALLSEPIIERMRLPKEHCLLITVQDGTIRQTFFDRGHMHFSRLSPLSDSSINGIAQAIAGEAAKTQQYLLSQRLISRSDLLAVHVLGHPQAVHAIATVCTGTETLRFQVHSHHDIARKLGVKTLPDDSRADFLFIHAAAAMPPPAQFARDTQRQEYRVWQIANALRAGGAIIFAGCALFVAKELLTVFSLNDRAEAARSSAALADQRYQSIAATFPAVPVSNDALRQITGKFGEFAQQGNGPAGLYGDLSRALEVAPQIDVDSIEWRLAGGQLSAARPASSASPDAAEIAIVKGTVNGGRNPNPREVLALFDAFVGELRRNPRLTITVQQQPFDLGAEKSLKSTDGTSTVSTSRPFAVTILRKAPA